MNHCLNAMETCLTNLLQAGLDTGIGDSGAEFKRLAEQCETCGLHTGSALMEKLSDLLNMRTHTLNKQDTPLIDIIFQAEHYITLCRERWQEVEILRSWKEYPNQNKKGRNIT